MGSHLVAEKRSVTRATAAEREPLVSWIRYLDAGGCNPQSDLARQNEWAGDHER